MVEADQEEVKTLLRCFGYIFIAVGLVAALWSIEAAILFVLLAIVCFLPSLAGRK